MAKIICLIDSIGAGGAERQMSYLVSLLKKHGNDVKLVVFTKQNKFYENFLLSNGIVPEYNIAGVNPFRRIWEIRKLVKQFQPDLVITYKDGVCISAILSKVFIKFKLAVSERSTTPHLSIKSKIKFWLYRFANHIVPNSYSQANLISRVYPTLTSKIRVICNTIDVDLFHPATRPKSNEIIEILTIARVKKIKNIINYLKAIAILKHSGINAHFSWYGKCDPDDEYPNEVSKEVERLNLSDYITFYDAVENVADIYRSADIFCLPSLIEGFPNAICEAMASGLPIVCSDICDNPHIVKSGKNGVLFNPKSPNDIAKKLKEIILLDTASKQNMAETNRKRIIEMCSSDNFVKKYSCLISD